VSNTDPGLGPLEIIIVAYGDPQPLVACLGGLEGAFNPVVVDNSSSPATRAAVEAGGGRYVDAGGNLGFGAGVNLGLHHRLQPDADVLLLNPDAVISPTDIGRLRQCLHDDPGLACVAPAQVDPANGRAAQVSWPIPSPAGAWLEAIGLGARRRAPHFVIGSVLLLRAAALAEIGGLDERFFLYAEETDWEMRARARGWRIALCDDAVATHIGAGTGGDTSRRETHFHASHERLIRKHHGLTGWQAYRAANIAGAWVRATLLGGDRKRQARIRLGLYLTGPCRAEAALTSPAPTSTP
jgi:GT2 family glycosyltransferase